MKTVATRISELKQQISNCIDSGNITWQYRAEGELNEILKQAPSGSGFDSGTVLESSTDSELIFNTAFHHMNGNGMYIGWTHHRVIARAVFGGFSLRITGKDQKQIKDYIGEVFYHWLSTEVKDNRPKQIQQDEKKRTTQKPLVLDYNKDQTKQIEHKKQLPAIEHKREGK